MGRSPVDLESVHIARVADGEFQRQRTVKLFADSLFIPQRMVEDNQRFGESRNVGEQAGNGALHWLRP
ncbi:MAG: hypothetical protein WDN31_05180 [Hyphomicrobium sp.]